MPEVIIVESVSKRFKLHRNRPATLKESVIGLLRGNREKGAKILLALRDVSFSVEQGRTLGIIGHNAAGKSTLLRLICGLGRPTAGRIRCIGHLGSLLELGSGFQSEMTGRENLMTGGILSGLTKRQVKASQEEIIAFAELEEFIDEPVRTYSTGMYLRLAFAAAVFFDPDFLVVDEVLAVGDIRFQQKCINRLNAFRVSGKSLIIVSHDLDQIRALCDEVLVLEEGRVVMQGDPENAINCYHDLMRQRTEKRAAQVGVGVRPHLPVDQGSRMGTQEATIDTVGLYNLQGENIDTLYSGDSLVIELEYTFTTSINDMALNLGIYTETNIKCFETSIASVSMAFGRMNGRGRFRCQVHAVPLLAGNYYVNVGLYPTNWSYVYDYHWQMHRIQVLNRKEAPFHVSGVVLMEATWSTAGEPE